MPPLIETCMESGIMTDAEINEKLAGLANAPPVLAIMSLIECAIGNERHANESASKRRLIDEHRGGSKALQALRRRLLEALARGHKVRSDVNKCEQVRPSVAGCA